MSDVPDRETILALEERALNAWPAVSVTHRDGWLLRCSSGHTKRANCVHMLHPGEEPVADKISWVEEHYRHRGLPPIFRMTPLTPRGVEEILTSRGYRVVEPSLVKLGKIEADWHQHDNVLFSALDNSRWIENFARAAKLTPVHAVVLHQMLRAVAPASILAHLEEDGAPVAFGMAVVENGCVGFFEMLTLPEVRRHGYAAAIMESLFAWARDQGASMGTLQVVETNSPARALYERFGMRTLYGYHYLVGPAD